MKLEFSSQIFEKSSNIKFNENLSGGGQVIPCRWTDGQTWQNYFSLFAILQTRLIRCKYFLVTAIITVINIMSQFQWC